MTRAKPSRVILLHHNNTEKPTMDLRRKSARLRGIGPELTLLEAGEVVIGLF